MTSGLSRRRSRVRVPSLPLPRRRKSSFASRAPGVPAGRGPARRAARLSLARPSAVVDVISIVDTRGNYADLVDVYWPIAVAVIVLVWLGLFALVIRYRSGDGDDSWPEQVHERTRVEAAYVAVLAVIAALLVFLTFSAMDRLSAELPREAAAAGRPAGHLTIDVVAARWNWRFDYRGLGIEQAGDGRSIPTLVVPVGDVRFTATSVDVIHSFFIPYLRFKRDAFPKRHTSFTLGFGEAGYHRGEGECAEFCGLRHAYMQFNVRVLQPAAFAVWVRARRSGAPQELTPALDRQGRR
jgi:cytochrome c oxidase subunit 2